MITRSLKLITTRADSAMNQSHLEVVTCHQRKRGKRRGPGHVAFRSYFLLAEKEAREFLANHKAKQRCG